MDKIDALVSLRIILNYLHELIITDKHCSKQIECENARKSQNADVVVIWIEDETGGRSFPSRKNNTVSMDETCTFNPNKRASTLFPINKNSKMLTKRTQIALIPLFWAWKAIVIHVHSLFLHLRLFQTSQTPELIMGAPNHYGQGQH